MSDDYKKWAEQPEQVNKGKRERHLKWYERQWWSGFLSGVQCGCMLGIATAVPVAYLAKWVVSLFFAA